MKKTETKNIIITCVVIFVLMLLETTANHIIRIGGVVPDLLYSFVLVFACTQKKISSISVVALVCGILSDFVCHSSFVGFTALYIYSGVLGYFLKNLFIRPNIIFSSVIALLIFITGKLIMYPVFLMSFKVGFAEYLIKGIIPEAFFNTLCFFVMMVIFNLAVRLGGKNNATVI